jgi:hypothetical protein
MYMAISGRLETDILHICVTSRPEIDMLIQVLQGACGTYVTNEELHPRAEQTAHKADIWWTSMFGGKKKTSISIM